MSPSLDGIVTAVVERLQHMAQAQRKYPQSRRSPRAYIKNLKDTSRRVPPVALPTGPMPDEPWYEPYEDEEYVPLIGEAVLAYQKEHSHRAKMSGYQIERAIYSFLDHAQLHENSPIWMVTRDACKRWRASLMEVPAAKPRASDGKATRIPSPVTLEKRLKMVTHFMNWCVEREWFPTNPMHGLSRPKRLVASAKVKKTSFSDEELAQIIPALLALPAHDLPRTEFKWAVLALMFSGARCMEICQLRHKDIRQVDGIWIFDIQNADEGHRVKNAPSVRLVPIHSQLIQLGFLDWEQLQQGERVFPTLFKKGSPLVSMWFTRTLKALGLKHPEVSLHSLRHTVAVKLAKVRTDSALRHRLLGHATGKSVEDRVYLAGLAFSAKELSEALEAVKFPV